ncbi:hypothetical protein B0I35DRAFT_464928 [Stachybotrys elegans]|uniref:RHS repeat-associated core domain-containing protein n=1 Tax=Stachybotrys elegans TaxID=80388 RepID=A0A8K0SIY9_9HYPO|nr:hypothetical protein B0I35DRAFT_464928 [Stachybotrys elegans]
MAWAAGSNRKIIQYTSQSAGALPVSITLNGYILGRKVGARTTTLSHQASTPKPAQITASRGDRHDLEYERGLGHVLTSRRSGDHTDTYQYDPQTAAPVRLTGSWSTTDLQYLPSGLLAQERIQINEDTAFSAKSTYSMAGKLQYYTDVHGQAHNIHYDSLGRPEYLSQGDLKVTIVYGQANRVAESRVQEKENNASLTTRLSYDDFGREIERTVYRGEEMLYRLGQNYSETGLVTERHLEDGNGNLLRHENFQYDLSNRLIRYQYRTQVTQITNTHPEYPSEINLEYDENGCLTRDEQGRILEYDTRNCLSTVRDSNRQILSQYRYDASGRLVCQMVPGQPDQHLHYRGNALIAVTMGNRRPDHAIHNQTYTPYGFSAGGSSSIGFNGQWRDPVTGWYHLGNGYRVYNPVLMRFHTPDTLSPFTSGEINPYTYCLGDPVNRVDPSGRFSIFRMEFTVRDLTVMAVGIGVGIASAVLTGGASLAIAAGVAIVAGAASDVATGAVYDLASGKTPTWKSVGTDALNGAIGEVGGRLLAKGAKVAARGIQKALGRAGSFTITPAVHQTPWRHMGVIYSVLLVSASHSLHVMVQTPFPDKRLLMHLIGQSDASMGY